MTHQNVDRHQRQLQEAEALELFRTGCSSREVGVSLGVSRATADRRLKAALERLGTQTAETYRIQVEDRYNSALKHAYRLLDEAQADDNRRDQLAAVKLIVGIENSRARLLGLSLPSSLVVRLEGLISDAP